MLILGENIKKDYYDGVVGTVGIDKTIVYDRNFIELDDNKIPRPFAIPKRGEQNIFSKFSHFTLDKTKSNYDDISCFIVGFCGKIYVGWKLYKIVQQEYHVEITYDAKFIKSILTEDTGKYRDDFNGNYKTITNYDAINVFREFKTPIFVFDYDYTKSIYSSVRFNRRRLFINPNLSDYCFYRVMDAFQTFQEIQMYIGGVLGIDENNTPVIEDKYRIAQHGFDKWSFRKESVKK